ncbi:MAG: 3-coathanger stack domain-containing protein, partial [Bacteroidota bacterium]
KEWREFYLSTFNRQQDTLFYNYDHQGRPIAQFHQLEGQPTQQLCQMNYTVKDQLKTKFLGGTTNGFLQQVDFAYLSNRFLKSINGTMSANDLFQLNLNYDQDVVGLARGRKNGNIASLQWQVKGGPSQQYGYAYDKLDRLTEAKYSLNNNAYGTEYGYDVRGNFTSIKRRGVYSDGLNFLPQVIDEMQFTPMSNNSNKILTIIDNAPCPDNKVIHQALDNTQLHAVATVLQADNVVNENADITYQAGTEITLKAGFHAKAGTNFTAKIADCPQSSFETDGFVQRSTDSYLYDANGNRINDPQNNIIDVAFNYLNQPYKVTWANGNTIEWLRDGSGGKLQQLTKRSPDVLRISKAVR